ncbi:hypothetical protein pEaSNUABM8_00094 [Erwinia phage pEa_SNUABM_8]|nr:hypothetical protein pEaSNUABM8_00094 [Erwinia phage pEa_SNUABM_8]QVW54846.1 hypothetical protein pEaSNUABM4_00093 [Erwinia phage pEa_SNUABM_4]
MEYDLSKTHITDRLFDGRGFLLQTHDTKQRRGLMSALESGHQLYVTRDVILVLRKWLMVWKDRVERRDFSSISTTLAIGEYRFVTHNFEQQEYKALEMIEKDQALKLLDEGINGLAVGFDCDVWRESEDSFYWDYRACSADRPHMEVMLSVNEGTTEYNCRINHVPAYPTILKDLSVVRIAESLFSIANTRSYPQSGYVLNLQLGFGNIDLASMTRDSLREMAERLIPL